MTQVFITDMQVRVWKPLYAFIFVWICIYFSVHKFLSCVSVIECIKNLPAFYGKYRLTEITWEFLRTRMQNFEIYLLKSILIQIWKSLFKFIKHNALKILHSLSRYLPVMFVYFVKSRLFLTSREFLEFKTQNFFEYCLYMNTNI